MTTIPAFYNAGSGGGGDTEPPTTPSGLTATAVSPTQVNLSWTASSDNVGVTGYRVYRDGARIVTVSGTSYSNRIADNGHDVLYSRAQAKDGSARFECRASDSGACHYTLFPEACAGQRDGCPLPWPQTFMLKKHAKQHIDQRGNKKTERAFNNTILRDCPNVRQPVNRKQKCGQGKGKQYARVALGLMQPLPALLKDKQCAQKNHGPDNAVGKRF